MEYMNTLKHLVRQIIPNLEASDFSFFDVTKYDVIFCNPNKQKYLLNAETLGDFSGTILTASTGLNHIDQRYFRDKNIKIISLKNQSFQELKIMINSYFYQE